LFEVNEFGESTDFDDMNPNECLGKFTLETLERGSLDLQRHFVAAAY
jgi:hypothetical protein